MVTVTANPEDDGLQQQAFIQFRLTNVCDGYSNRTQNGQPNLGAVDWYVLGS